MYAHTCMQADKEEGRDASPEPLNSIKSKLNRVLSDLAPYQPYTLQRTFGDIISVKLLLCIV